MLMHLPILFVTKRVQAGNIEIQIDEKGIPEESAKVKQFYADHLNDEVDEAYLKNLANYLNQ